MPEAYTKAGTSRIRVGTVRVGLPYRWFKVEGSRQDLDGGGQQQRRQQDYGDGAWLHAVLPEWTRRMPHQNAQTGHSPAKAGAEGDMHSCELLYCREDPGSRQCLQTTQRASGSGWYQISSQSAGLGKGRIGIHCTNVPLKQRRGINIEIDVFGRWTYKAGGREMELSSLGAAARSACQSRAQR